MPQHFMKPTQNQDRNWSTHSYRASHNLVVIECQGHFISIANDIIINMLADGHTVSNAPDLFRPPKLSGTGPFSTGVGDRPGSPQGAVSFAQVFALFAEILKERRTQKLERYTRHREVDVTEQEIEHVSRWTQAQTQKRRRRCGRGRIRERRSR